MGMTASIGLGALLLGDAAPGTTTAPAAPSPELARAAEIAQAELGSAERDFLLAKSALALKRAEGVLTAAGFGAQLQRLALIHASAKAHIEQRFASASARSFALKSLGLSAAEPPPPPPVVAPSASPPPRAAAPDAGVVLAQLAAAKDAERVRAMAALEAEHARTLAALTAELAARGLDGGAPAAPVAAAFGAAPVATAASAAPAATRVAPLATPPRTPHALETSLATNATNATNATYGDDFEDSGATDFSTLHSPAAAARFGPGGAAASAAAAVAASRRFPRRAQLDGSDASYDDADSRSDVSYSESRSSRSGSAIDESSIVEDAKLFAQVIIFIPLHLVRILLTI